MAVDYDRFLSWVESKFPPEDIKFGKNDEIRLRSIFHPDKEDNKFRLYCSPSGGKNKRPNGVFHCFDTDKKGSLINFVMIVENCTYEEALEILGGANANIERLEKLANEIIYGKKEEIIKEEPKETILSLPLHTYKFNDLPSFNNYRIHAEKYLENRSLPTDDFLICVRGEYRNRIIIPYYDKEGKLVYYNGRYVGNSEKTRRYQFPDKEVVDRTNVLYFPKWPNAGSKVYLTEGEFDAYSIYLSGLNAAAFGGKYLAETQMELLRDYIPVLCLDTDPSGEAALLKIGDSLLANGFTKVYYIRPPKQVKDWNDLLQISGSTVLKTYIESKEKPYSSWTSTAIGFNKV